MISNSVGWTDRERERPPLSPPQPSSHCTAHKSTVFCHQHSGRAIGQKEPTTHFLGSNSKGSLEPSLARSLALSGRKWPDKKVSLALTHMAARPTAEFIQVLPAFKSRYERLLRTEVMLIHCCCRPLGRRCLSERLPESPSQKSDGFGAVAEMRRPAIIYPF